MKNEKLFPYVASRVRGGAKKSDVKEELLAVGWSEEEADAAYAQALIEGGIPVPEGTGAFARKSSTADIMIGFFSFILLGIVVSAIGTLFFEVIDRFFPDPAANGAFGSTVSLESVHYSTAALLIGFPLYFFAVRLWFRRFREDDGRTESRLTKWVTYLVLLAASVTIVGDLIAILFTFLQGEITARFFLKALVVLGIAGMVFGFYFLERKKIQYRQDISRSVFQSFGWGLLGVIVLGITLGFVTAGSPETARQRALDARRASDLSALAGCVRQYAEDFSRLPRTLADLQASTDYNYCPRPNDPETGNPYAYRVVKDFDRPEKGSEAMFELCAVFGLHSEGDTSSTEPLLSEYGPTSGKWSAHEAGKSCDTEMVVLKRSLKME
jgi:hypothetical protein